MNAPSLTKSLTRFLKNLLGNRIKVHQVNRDCITLIPKEPFIQWVIGLPHAKELENFYDPESGQTINLVLSPEEIRQTLSTGHNAYLLPATDTGKLEEETLRAVYKIIFERELSDWNTNQKTWPKKRTLENFLEWFDIGYHDGIYDLCETPPVGELMDD